LSSFRDRKVGNIVIVLKWCNHILLVFVIKLFFLIKILREI